VRTASPSPLPSPSLHSLCRYTDEKKGKKRLDGRQTRGYRREENSNSMGGKVTEGGGQKHEGEMSER